MLDMHFPVRIQTGVPGTFRSQIDHDLESPTDGTMKPDMREDEVGYQVFSAKLSRGAGWKNLDVMGGLEASNALYHLPPFS